MNGKSETQKVKPIEYRFADFSINQSQQVLVKGNEKLVISTKPYYLLLTFLENPGKILKKDDVINAVWPGQIVTDTALTKQIVRLRKLIGDDDLQNPMIETHRGVGYRFTVSVEQHAIEEDKPVIHHSEKAKTTSSYWFYLFLILAMISVIYFFYPSRTINNIKNTTDERDGLQTLFAGISLAIIPSNNNQDWLNTGGLNQLSQMLDKNSMISTIKPRPEWYKNTETDKLGIEITSHKQIHYAFLVDIIEKDNQIFANLKLRTYEKIIASDNLSAPNISQMLVKINNWVGKILLADKKINEFYLDNTVSHDNYAMESYLQGVFYQEFNDDKKANEFYQAAVNKDDGFIQAWLQLADTFSRMGSSERAIAIAENTINKFNKDLTTKQLIKLNYIIGMSYFFSGDSENAENYISQSVNLIEKTNNPLTKLTALDSLGVMAFLQKDMQAAEKYTLQRVTIAKDFYPFPNYISAMNLILAEIKGSQGKLEESKVFLYSAIEYYEKSNDSAGMIRAIVSMNTINLMQNHYDEGLSVIQKAEAYLTHLSNPDFAFKFMASSVYIFNLRGHFDKSNDFLKKMQKISSQSNNPMDLVAIELLNIHRYYVQNKFSQAKIHLDSMAIIFENNKTLVPIKHMYYLADLLLSARLQSGEEALEKYNDYLKNHPDLKQVGAAELDRSLGHINVKLGNIKDGIKFLTTAQESYLNISDKHHANTIGFEILEVLQQHPELDYKPKLAKMSTHTDYDYLFFKLKAGFLAREKRYFDAALIMSENKLKANQLWDADDQLLLEDYQFKSKN